MTCKPIILIGMLLLFLVGGINAQLKIPTFDVELKVHQTLIPGEGGDNGELEVAEATNFYIGAHVQINQYVALGGFYSRSFRGTAKFRYNDSNVEEEMLQLQKGIDFRLTTGRAKKWRYALTLSFAQLEMVEPTESYRLAAKSTAFGATIGIMRRLSNNLYLNVIELGPTFMSDEIFWFNTDDTIILNAKMGLTYNIGKRK